MKRLIFFGVFAASVVQAEALPIREAAIVYEPFAKRAATELKTALDKVVATELPLKAAPAADWTGPRIVFAKTVRADVTNAGFAQAADGQSVTLAAKTGMGADNAVIEFLRRYADYWYVTVLGDDPVVVNPLAAVPSGTFVWNPAIPFRDFFSGREDGRRCPKTIGLWRDFLRHTRVTVENKEMENENRLSWTCGNDCHTSYLYCDPKKYFKDHPEYFSMTADGKRQCQPTGQICYTNPKTYEIVRESLLSFIEKDRAKNPTNCPTIYDFSQQDNTDWLCFCPDCKKVIAKHNRVPGGNKEGGDTGLQLEFVNRLAREARARWPDVVLRTMAYVSTSELPADGLKPEPNVLAWVCDMYGESDHQLPLEHPFNAARAKVVRDWSPLAPIEMWDYFLYDDTIPEVFLDALKTDAAFFAANRVKRLFHETRYNDQAFFEFNVFCAGALSCDPALDPEMLVAKYCRVYGKGAAKMAEAINLLRRYEREEPPKTEGEWTSRLFAWSTPEKLGKLLALMEEAYRLEDVGIARSRIAKALKTVCWRLMIECRKTSGASAVRAKSAESYRSYAKENAAFTVMEPNDRASAAKGIDDTIAQTNLSFKDLPAELTGVDESDLIALWYRNCACDPGGEWKADPDSSCLKSVVWREGRDHSKWMKQIGGVYDKAHKTNTPFSWTYGKDVTFADEKYHWVKLGVARVGSNAFFWAMFDWNQNWHLQDYYINCDGLPVDPNWYEFWVSIKYCGSAYVFGSTKPNAVWIDRVLLHRVPPPGVR